MTPTLTLAECWLLKEHGLEQGDGWYWWWCKSGFVSGGMNPIKSSKGDEYMAYIPTEAELREFVMKKWQEQHPNATTAIGLVISDKQVKAGLWFVEADSVVKQEGPNLFAPSVSAALFALAKQVCGGGK